MTTTAPGVTRRQSRSSGPSAKRRGGSEVAVRRAAFFESGVPLCHLEKARLPEPRAGARPVDETAPESFERCFRCPGHTSVTFPKGWMWSLQTHAEPAASGASRIWMEILRPLPPHRRTSSVGNRRERASAMRSTVPHPAAMNSTETRICREVNLLILVHLHMTWCREIGKILSGHGSAGVVPHRKMEIHETTTTSQHGGSSSAPCRRLHRPRS